MTEVPDITPSFYPGGFMLQSTQNKTPANSYFMRKYDCMFLVLGTLAIVTAIGTVILGLNGKNPEVLRFISVSLTALTVCAFYQMDAQYVAREDWSALMDVTSTGVALCWIGTVASILINSISFFIKKKRR
jgi:hypothetical protein